MKYLLIVILFFVAIPGSVIGQIEFREILKEEDWNAAMEDARTGDKLVFLDIYATWCGPCKYLENNVYTDKALGEYYNENYINLKMDGESPFGAKMAHEYALTAYPTMYFLQPDEQIITMLVGVREANPLNSLGKTISENAERLIYYEENFNQGNLNANELKNYQQLLVKIEQTELANEVANRIIPSLTEEDILSPDFKNVVINSSTDMDGKVFSVVSENRDKLSETWSAQEIDQLYSNIFNATLSKAISGKNEELLERIIDEFLPVYMGENSEQLSQGKFATRKLYFANTLNWETFEELVNKEFEEKHPGDDTFLYRQAYEVANEYNQSPEALSMAVTWMEKANKINASFENLVLTAFFYGMKGNYEQAAEIVERIKGMEVTEEQKKILDELIRRLEQAEAG
ncbi:MAG: thioredoxin family protein [Bacteroidota bacterium]